MQSTNLRQLKYRQIGYWGDATLYDYFRFSVLRFPDKTAVADKQGTTYTYRQLDDAAGKIAAYLKDVGVMPGDFVSIQLPGWSEFTVIYIGCLKAGAVVNPILPNYREQEVKHILQKCESKVCFVPSEYRGHKFPEMMQALSSELPSLKQVVSVEKEKSADDTSTFANILTKYSSLSEVAPRSADDLAAVLFTSGTEGHLKGVMFTHNNIISSENAFTSELNIKYNDVFLMPAPVAHATGFHHGITASFMVGAKSVLLDRFTPKDSLRLIEKELCTYTMGATPILYDILKEMATNKYDTSSLCYFLCGGAPIPRNMVVQAMDLGINVIAVYGSTESAPHTMTRPEDTIEHIINSDGKAVPCTEVRVVDEQRRTVGPGVQGEEASRGPNVFVGYLKEPELTSQKLDDEGWYYSGDLCIMDADGYIRITGRKNDVIIRGGENIIPLEIEGYLRQMPEIADASVVGMPDTKFGERICAYVIPENPETALTFEMIKAFFERIKVAKCKYPEHIEVVSHFPRVPSGKVRKDMLKQDIRNKMRN